MPLATELPPAEWVCGTSPERIITEVGNAFLATKEVAFDTETTGLHILADKVLYWSLSWDEGHRTRRICLRNDMLQPYASALKSDKRWILCNAKFDMHMLANTTGQVLKGVINDVAVQHGLYYEDMSHSLKDINYQLFGWRWNSFEETFGKVNTRDKTDSIGRRLRLAELTDLPRLVEYASNDAFGTLRSYQELRRRMENRPTHSICPDRIATLWDYFEQTEAPFTRVLWMCERLGMQVDRAALENLRERILAAELTAKKLLWQAAGRPLNPHSADDVREYVFAQKHYAIRKMTKGGTTGIQQPAVDKNVLADLALETGDPVLKLIVECKKLHNLHTTFLGGIERMLDKNDRVHTQFNQNEAVTGRLSSKNPNMQNVVHPDNDPFGIRSLIIAMRGMKLGIADYTALEMMLLAEAACDPKLLSIFDRGWDVHMGNASIVFGIDYEEISSSIDLVKKMKKGLVPPEAINDRHKMCVTARQRVKTISYGLNYGMKDRKLSKQLGISLKEAQDLIARYMATYPAVSRFFLEVQQDLERDGCVYTMLGRVRSLPEIGSPVDFERWRAGRQGANTVIQGSAAECAKMAMLRLYEEKLPERTGWFVLSQIHDEIITEGPEETAEEAMQILQQCMENPLWVPLRVKLKASPTIANSWQDAK